MQVCPICDGEMRVDEYNPEKFHYKAHCTRCRKYDYSQKEKVLTIYIRNHIYMGNDRKIKRNAKYKNDILVEKVFYKVKKIIQRIFNIY